MAENTSSGSRNYFWPVLIAVVLLLWYFTREKFGSMEILNADYYVGLFSLLFVIGVLSTIAMKYHTPQFIAIGLNKSVASRDRPLIIGNWAAIRLGGNEEIPYPPNDGIALVPKFTLKRLGKGFVSPVHMYQFSKENLPDDVEQEITARKWNTSKVYIGWMTESFEIKNPSYLKMLSWCMKVEKINSQLNSLLNNKYKMLEDYMEHHGRLTDSQKKGIADWFKKPPVEDVEEN